jgi:TDG/mug DNA glycosylase family protein
VRLKALLLENSPLLICFNGMTAWANYLRYAESVQEKQEFGEQKRLIGTSRAFVVPSPSPANAAFSLEQITAYYRQAQELRGRLVKGAQIR